jgi:hypothetical protein
MNVDRVVSRRTGGRISVVIAIAFSAQWLEEWEIRRSQP